MEIVSTTLRYVAVMQIDGVIQMTKVLEGRYRQKLKSS